MKKILCLCGFLLTSAYADNGAKIEYLPSQTPEDKIAYQAIQSSGVNAIFLDLSKRHFPFKNGFTLQYGSDDGPLFDPEKKQLMIPYRFYNESLNYLKKIKDGESAQQKTNDALLHTLLHEAGHAYIADQDIPVLGKEEDAVDDFATLLLLKYVEGGDAVAINAADLFALESEDRPDYYDIGEYAGEHSFDLQRYFSTLCLVYGHNPEKHPNLLDEVERDYLPDRKDFCPFRYDWVNKNWHRFLKS